MNKRTRSILFIYLGVVFIIFLFISSDPESTFLGALMPAIIIPTVLLIYILGIRDSIKSKMVESDYVRFLKGKTDKIPVFPKPRNVHFYFRKKRLPSTFTNYLEKEYKFYRELNNEMKRAFEHRVAAFMELKTFITRDGLVLRHNMKLLISAAAVQVTFGLKRYYLDRFDQFFIYPKKFFSKFSKQWSLGETNPRGAVVFSWEDFLFGMAHDNDKLNLGFHEFAHALYVNEKIYEDNYLFGKYYNIWVSEIKRTGKIDFIREKNIFRRYAFTNHQELFAVAVEVFFERPQDFKNELPRMYKILSLMLNQDTLSKKFSRMKRRYVRS